MTKKLYTFGDHTVETMQADGSMKTVTYAGDKPIDPKSFMSRFNRNIDSIMSTELVIAEGKVND